MAFKIGDRVVIVRSRAPERIGQLAVITSDLRPASWAPPVKAELAAMGAPDGTPVHRLDLAPIGPYALFSVYPPAWLELYRDDGSEKVEWTAELRRLCGGRVTA